MANSNVPLLERQMCNYYINILNDKMSGEESILDMMVSDFTVPELERLREQCNFVGSELQVFEYRSRGVSLEEIAELLNMSVTHIGRISQKVNKKIKKVQ